MRKHKLTLDELQVETFEPEGTLRRPGTVIGAQAPGATLNTCVSCEAAESCKGNTCENTCEGTCPNDTCPDTCLLSCRDTCPELVTCDPRGPTCGNACFVPPTSVANTCYNTCAFTCLTCEECE